jgi:hypothetical protein
VEGLGLDLPLLLEAVDDVLIAPTDLVREALLRSLSQQCAEADESGPITLTVQYLRPGFRRRTRRASGTTMRFLRSYGGGTPSKSLRRSRAAAPRAVL